VARELERLFQASSYQGDEDLVFGHPHTGRPLDRSRTLKRFKAALARAGVREIRFHDLRHTFGTRMAAAGVPIRTLQEWMGHRDYKTTLIYADYAPAANEAALVNAACCRSPGFPRLRRSGSGVRYGRTQAVGGGAALGSPATASARAFASSALRWWRTSRPPRSRSALTIAST